MLDQIDLNRRTDKAAYKKIMPPLTEELGDLERKIRAARVPVLVVFEGWSAAGKGTLINTLIQAMDPRGHSVHPIQPPNEEERLRPFLWRFWIRTPARGRIAIFDRSWYRRVLVERLAGDVSEAECERSFTDINAFERQLADDGAVLVKFFLHISEKEQRKRLEKLEGNPSTAWRVTKKDWRENKTYARHARAVEEMLQRTDRARSPWIIVESHDERHASLRVFQTLVDAFKRRLGQPPAPEASGAPPAEDAPALKTPAPGSETERASILATVDLGLSLRRAPYEHQLKKYQKRIRELEHEVYMKRTPVLIVYEGWDASGKGGNIRRLTQNLDPRGYQVIPIGAPNDLERSHHYLWRFWTAMPKAGHIAVFDRSWYGRVLVERVEKLTPENVWRRAFHEINEMEEHLVNFGAVLLKFWLHVSKEEQLRRFEERRDTPHKHWKITDEDWRNRRKWDDYLVAVEEMLLRTSTTYAPWTIVESDSKTYARIKVLRTVVDALEKRT